MWKDDDEEEERGSLDLVDEITRNIEEIFSGFHDSLFDVAERSLKPLYRIETTEENVRVSFDLPFVAKREDLSLTATEKTLSIEAKTSRPVSMMVGGPYQKRVEFVRYCATIKLPTRVNPDKAKAKFRNGILAVEFPSSKTSRPVRIE